MMPPAATLRAASASQTRAKKHDEIRRRLRKMMREGAARQRLSGGVQGFSMNSGPRAGVTIAGSLATLDAQGAIEERLDSVRADCRDAALNSAPYQAIANTMVDAVVGDTGLLPKSQVTAEATGVASKTLLDDWNGQVDELFRTHKDSADVTSRVGWSGLCELAFRSFFNGGDVFPSFPVTVRDDESLVRVNLIEAERVLTPFRQMQNPRIQMGVQVDKWGAPVGFHVSREHPGARVVRERNRHRMEFWRRRVPLSTGGSRLNIVQLMHQERIGQPRGVPFLASVLDLIEKVDGYVQNTLDQADLQAKFATAILTEGDPEELASELSYDDVADFYAENYPDGLHTDGRVNVLRAGDKLQTEGQKQPGQYFDAFVVRLLRLACAPRSVPYTVAFGDTRGSNFSSQRSEQIGLMQTVQCARRVLLPMCKHWRTHLIHNAWLDGKLPPVDFERAIEAWTRAAWEGPRRYHVDPTKEIQAYVLAIQWGLMSRTEVVEALGGDRAMLDVFLELEKETKEAADRGISISAAAAAPAKPADDEPDEDDEDDEDDEPKTDEDDDTEDDDTEDDENSEQEDDEEDEDEDAE